jgi:predicted MFS family arabinose efflux permease
MAHAPTGARPDGERLFTRAFLVLSASELAYFTAAGLVIPVLPLFAARHLGGGDVGAGIAVGAFSVTALILRPYAGRASDRYGRRPLLVWGALLCAVATALTLLVPNLASLVGLRLVLGVAEAFFFVAGFAAVADLAPPNRTGEALSYNSLSLYLGIALGPLLGETLLEAGGFAMAWIGAAGLALLAGALAFTLREPAPADRPIDGGPSPLICRAAIAPAIGLAAGVAGMAGFFAFVALYAQDLQMSGARGVLLMFGLIVVGCRVSFAKVPDRVPPFRLAGAALAMCAGGLAVVGLSGSVDGLFVGAAILAVGISFITPAFFAATFARVPAAERGAAAGTVSLFLDLAFGAGPLVLGLVADASSIPTAFGLAASVAATGAAGTLAYAVWASRTVRRDASA